MRAYAYTRDVLAAMALVVFIGSALYGLPYMVYLLSHLFVAGAAR